MPPLTGRPPTPVTGSASVRVLGQVSGPRRAARVLHTGRDAAYLDVDGTCVALLGAQAVQVPCGVRTPLAVLPRLAPGSEAVVDDGAVEVSGLVVRVARIVDTTVPVLGADAASRGAATLAEAVGDRLARVLAELPPLPLALLERGDPAAAAGLLGLGPGLTPLGDDVLAGWLATAVARRHPLLPAVRSAVALTAHERTTTLSATLLACAGRGEVVPEFGSLLRGLAGGHRAVLAQPLARLLRIGDTSGAGLVLGALTALRSPSPSPVPRGEAA